MKIKTIQRKAYHGNVHNIGVIDDESYVIEGQKVKNCRGIWVAILKTDAELPKVKTLPKSIKNRFETVEGVPEINNFEPLKQPIIRKGSRLEKKIERGEV